jgi:hypothetical protein
MVVGSDWARTARNPSAVRKLHLGKEMPPEMCMGAETLSKFGDSLLRTRLSEQPAYKKQ